MTGGPDRAKEAAASAAVAEVARGQKLALGTGSTTSFALREIARRFPDGGELECVASSSATEDLARSLHLHVRAMAGGDRFDLMIDGADEVSDALDLTKGRGGALFREKLLARRSARLIIVVDASKLVPLLGTRVPIPIEVVPFARPVILDELAGRGLAASLRTVPGSTEPMRTDNGLEILDVRPPKPIDAPGALDAELRGVPGVVETGIFVGLAERVYIGRPDGSVEQRGRR